MPRLPDSVIGDAYSSSFVRETLVDLVDVGNRMAGQDGERRGAEVVADAFEAAGLRSVAVEEFPIDGWWRGDSALAVADRGEHYGVDHQVIALPGTPAGTASAELVDVGAGGRVDFEAADLSGKVAMASSRTPEDADRWVHRMEKYVGAVEAGAEAFVFRNHVDGCLPPTGEVGYDNRPGPIPAVGVSAELGARLARYCRDGAPEVTVEVDCRNDPATSRNVEAVVGPDTDRELLVTAHVDAHDIAEGANDNGAGSAIVAEVGRLLAAAEDRLDTRVRLITFGSEEIGLKGATHWVGSHDPDRVKCVLNVDGAGGSRNLRVGTNGFEAVADAFEAVTDDLGAPLSTDDGIMPHGDQWSFVQEGIPGAFVSAETEGSGRGYGHTHADTFEKLDVRDLRAIAVQVAEGALELADRDRTVEHKSRAAIREEIDEGYEQELKTGGRWPYEDLDS